MIVGNATDAPPAAEPEAAPAPPPQQRTWTMPKSPVTREHVDELGRLTVKAGAGLATVIASLARSGVRALTRGWRALGALPPALRLLGVLGALMLMGVVGSIALTGTRELFCAVVIVPACAIALGAVGHRWVSERGGEPAARTDARGADELARSVAYVDQKLAIALGAFGSERHQQAMLALVQAKTAAELALGAQGDALPQIGAPMSAGDQRRRPRIRAGAELAAS